MVGERGVGSSGQATSKGEGRRGGVVGRHVEAPEVGRGETGGLEGSAGGEGGDGGGRGGGEGRGRRGRLGWG